MTSLVKCLPFELSLLPSSPPGYRKNVADKMRGENLATRPRIFPPGSSLTTNGRLQQEPFTLVLAWGWNRCPVLTLRWRIT